MRNFEALGCGAHMISDVGVYPENFEMNKHFSTYNNMEECFIKIKELLSNDTLRQSVAEEGHQMIKEKYSKEKQWQAFQKKARLNTDLVTVFKLSPAITIFQTKGI